MLRTHLLRVSADADIDWSDVLQGMRGFVAGRVPAAAVDDVVQDTLVRVHRGLERGDVEHVPAWIARVARNTVADYHRASAARARLEVLSDALDEASASDDPHASPTGAPSGSSRPGQAEATDSPFGPASEPDAAAALASCVLPFLDTLPEPYREALRLTEIDGLTQREAARRVGISHSGMKSRVQRGRAMLRERVEACCVVALDARRRIVDFEPRPVPECC